ncbi:MAG: relaxase/mobilization nuclease domain-containing protein [Clostridia bacterium]|nr:relaxase/mobilization nuclease domain-containing protein [Clostridia bacterium]MBQ4556423.1 relaxase/mobilization nuclease domain-containing protein [Clostridia bacterium]
MATVTFIPEAKQSVSAMRGLINYCLQDCKVRDEQSGRRLVGGVNCNGENAYTEFMTTKNSYGKTTGMNFYQYVQSFSPREDITPERAHQIGLEFAQKAWPGHEVLVTTHSDAEHIHSHFVINSVNFENGYKLRQNPQSLIKLRALSDEICKAYGLSTLARYEGGGSKVSSREYRAAVKGESWKFRLMSDIDSAMNKSDSKQDFIFEMQRRGYEITWTDERKYITFACPNGKKCRDKTLHDEKYLKENIEYELQFRQQHYKNRKQFGGEPYEEKRARDSRDAQRRSARYGSDSGKGLGYDGESVTVGGGFSTEGVRTDENPSDRIKNGFNARQMGGDRGKILQPNVEGDGRQTEHSANGGGEYFASDEEPRTTGWESSRKSYERYFGTGQGVGEGYRQGAGENRPPHMVDPHGDIGGSLAVGGGVINSALRSLAGVTDGSEDPEERRKRIEEEQNASNLGAVIGLAVGLASAATDSTDDELPEDLAEEQNEITMKM